jgi:hypothetical protein
VRRPIDFVAEGIAGVASAQRSGIGCYHVVNPHWDDKISLDQIVSWVISAGYPIKCATLQSLPDLDLLRVVLPIESLPCQ